MTETRDIQSVVDAAEQAAAAGDYSSAEQLLTEVAVLQGASLGPLHPDLANTLNNLGVVCEILEKPARAERHFRRAYEIAKASLEPDHPFVATSRKNLEDFCNTRGIPVDAPPSEPEVSAEIEMPASLRPMPSEPEPERPIPSPLPAPYDDVPAIDAVDLPLETPSYKEATSSYEEQRPAASGRWSWPVAIAALVAGALVVTLIATAPWRSEPAPDAPKQIAAEPPKPIAAEPPPPVAAAPKSDDPAPTPPAPTPPAPTALPAPPVPPSDAPPPTPAAKSPPTRTAPSAPPTLVGAQLCQTLSTRGNWNCVPTGEPVSPGTLFFYSRLKSATDTTVQHRWYRGDRLRQTVELRIRANPGGGYRTYSRQTVDGQSASDWRVELRTSEGVLLHEERFVVR